MPRVYLKKPAEAYKKEGKMLIVAQGHERYERAQLFDQLFCLRARLHADRCCVNGQGMVRRNRTSGRCLPPDGQPQTDCFDGGDAVYIALASLKGKVFGAVRLLPTLAPHKFHEIFPQAVAKGEPVRGPLIWEASAFVVNTQAARIFGPNGLHWVSGELFLGAFKWAMAEGVQSLIAVYDPCFGRLMRRAGLKAQPLASCVTDQGVVVGGLFEVSQNQIQALASRCLEGDYRPRMMPFRAAASRKPAAEIVVQSDSLAQRVAVPENDCFRDFFNRHRQQLRDDGAKNRC